MVDIDTITVPGSEVTLTCTGTDIKISLTGHGENCGLKYYMLRSLQHSDLDDLKRCDVAAEQHRWQIVNEDIDQLLGKSLYESVELLREYELEKSADLKTFNRLERKK